MCVHQTLSTRPKDPTSKHAAGAVHRRALVQAVREITCECQLLPSADVDSRFQLVQTRDIRHEYFRMTVALVSASARHLLAFSLRCITVG